MTNMKIHYRGLIGATTSWAQVNRQLVLQLDKLGHDVSVEKHRGYGYESNFILPPRITVLEAKPRNTDVEIVMDYPLQYQKLTGTIKVGILFYESTILPPRWVRAINQHLDHLAVSSEFCRRVAIESGINDAKVSCFPLGYDPEIYHPRGTPRDLGLAEKFVFIHIATPHKRKGTRDLIQAFLKAFTKKDEVALVLKTNFSPRGLPWESDGIEAIVAQESQGRADLPSITVINTKEPDAVMPLYLAASDCCVQPSYSEGYGLVALEAMACGIPVITTGWSGVMDFCTSENAFLLRYQLIPAGEMQYDFKEGNGQVAKPDMEHLIETLRHVYNHPDEARHKAERALKDNGHLTWENSARALMKIIRSLLLF